VVELVLIKKLDGEAAENLTHFMRPPISNLIEMCHNDQELNHRADEMVRKTYTRTNPY
jgi:hypothetical protein